MSPFPRVLTLSEAAKLLLTTADLLESEIHGRALRGFRIAGEWRTTEEALLEFIGEAKSQPAECRDSDARPGKPATEAAVTCESDGDAPKCDPLFSEPAEPFQHKWPDGYVESYTDARTVSLNAEGRTVSFRIGFTTRNAAGQDRVRAVVFVEVTSGVRPVVEFVAGNDFGETSRMVSVVKNRKGQHVRTAASLPPEYKEMQIVPYNEFVTGPYASRALAVLADKDDHATMVKHATIRCRYKGWA